MKTVSSHVSFSAALLALLVLAAPNVRSQGLVGHWKLDEGSGRNTADSSGNGNTGALRGIGGPTWVAGQLGNALRFDGSDEYVNVPSSPVFGITGDITLAAWIKREAPLAYDAIIAKTDGANAFDYDFYFSDNDNRLRFWSDSGNPTPVFSTREVADLNWHHVAVTRTGSTVAFYIDGIDAGTTTMDGAFANNAIPIRIGTDGPEWSPGSLFQGTIDEARIYNRALTPAEIRALNVSGTGPEIVVVGNATTITAGDTTPSFADGTDFGVVDIGASVTRVYDIYNFGSTTLTLGAVSISGAHAADFTITVHPAASVASGGSTTLSIHFSPGGLGRRSATVSFSNNDSNENPFTFAIQGSGLSTTVFPGFLTREVFNGIPGEQISDLTNNAKFPNFPDASEIIAGFEAPINAGTDFGQRIYGFLTPSESANYIFFMSSDDRGQLWLSTDETPANKVLIATEPQWNTSRDWSGTSRRPALENRSAAIHLEAGRRYYVEALSKEGGGGDNLAVTATKEGDPLPEFASIPLQGFFVGTFGVPGPSTVTITTQPQDVTATVARTATFVVAAESSSAPIVYQWQKNGANIFKATTPIFTTPPLTATDNGAQYRCIALISSGAMATSDVASVSVIADVLPPRVLKVHALGDPVTGQATKVTVVYDEPVEEESAVDGFNYAINGGDISIPNITLRPNLKSVVLDTAPIPSGAFYTLTVERVLDRASPSNQISHIEIPFRVTHLAAHYGFEDLQNLGADSVSGNDGSLFAAPVLISGQPGNAVSLDNIADYVSAPSSPDFAIANDITLAAWIKRQSFLQYGGLISKTDGVNTWDFSLLFENGRDQVSFYSDTTTPTTIVSSNTVADTAWHHVAFTRSGNLATFYIDGAEAGTATLDGAFGNNPNPLRIGTDGPGWDPSSMFYGAIDEARIYNRALTAAEIQALTSSPRLAVSVSGGNVVLSWSAAAVDFILESTDSLSPANWTVVPEMPIVSGGQNTLSLTIGSNSQFYRLKQ
jgi:concanavalin A-like lectin/glucanase superfamily protein/HYDIN/CFA65/VesB family protein